MIRSDFCKMKMEGVYLVTDDTLCLGRSLVDVVSAAVCANRVDGSMPLCAVQLREKRMDSREFVAQARAVAVALEGSGVPLIINDRADIAQIVNADGLHIGQSDIKYADARRLLGDQAIIGLSIEQLSQIDDVYRHYDSFFSGLDYVAASPVFSTDTKHDIAPALGLTGVAYIRKLVDALTSSHGAVSCMSVVAIGGIDAVNCRSVTNAGADSVAVVSAICSAPDPAAAVANIYCQGFV